MNTGTMTPMTGTGNLLKFGNRKIVGFLLFTLLRLPIPKMGFAP